MKKLTATAIAMLTLLLVLTSGTPALAWTLEDCKRVAFQHPDCAQYRTPTPKPTSPTRTPARTASAAPTVQTPTPTFPPGTFPVQPPTAKPAPTTAPSAPPAIRQLPSTSTD